MQDPHVQHRSLKYFSQDRKYEEHTFLHTFKRVLGGQYCTSALITIFLTKSRLRYLECCIQI